MRNNGTERKKMKSYKARRIISALALSMVITACVQAEEGATAYGRVHREISTVSTETSTTSYETRESHSGKEARVFTGVGVGDVILPNMKSHRMPRGLTKTVRSFYGNYNAGILAKVKDGGKWGLVGTDGSVLIAPKYKELDSAGVPGMFWATEKKTPVLIDKNGNPLPAGTSAPAVHADGEDDLTPFKEKGKYGFKDSAGNVKIGPVYKEVLAPFSEGITFVKNGDGKKVAVDTTGKELFAAPYDELFAYHDGLAEYRRNVHKLNWGGLVGIVLGNVVGGGGYYGIYDDYYGIYNGFTLSYDGVKRGYIDRSGTVVIDSKNDEVWPITAYGTFVKNKGKLGFMNRKGAYIIEPGNYDIAPGVWDDAGGLIAIKDKGKGKYAVFSLTDGMQMSPFAYDNITFHGSNRIVLTKNKRKLFVDEETGTIIAEYPEKSEIGLFGVEKYAWLVDEKGIYHIIDTEGTVLYSAQPGSLTAAMPFLNGVTVVKSKGVYGIMDSKGNWIVKPAYKEIKFL